MTKLDLVCYNKRNFIFASESSGLDKNQSLLKGLTKHLKFKYFIKPEVAVLKADFVFSASLLFNLRIAMKRPIYDRKPLIKLISK